MEKEEINHCGDTGLFLAHLGAVALIYFCLGKRRPILYAH